MYTGQWGQDFVKIIQREGGKVTAEDLKRYQPIWSEPYKTDGFRPHSLCERPAASWCVRRCSSGLNLAEALKLDQKGPYWTDPEAFQAMAPLEPVCLLSSRDSTRTRPACCWAKGIDISPAAQTGKEICLGGCALLGQIFGSRAEQRPQTLQRDRRHRQGGQHRGRDAHDQLR